MGMSLLNPVPLRQADFRDHAFLGPIGYGGDGEHLVRQETGLVAGCGGFFPPMSPMVSTWPLPVRGFVLRGV